MIKIDKDQAYAQGLIKVTNDPNATHFSCNPVSNDLPDTVQWDVITYYKKPSLLTHTYTEREVLDILRDIYVEYGSESMIETFGRAMNREVTVKELYD